MECPAHDDHHWLIGDEVQGEEDDVQGSKLKLKQYEQPGELITLPSGIQYREIETGRGKEASLGSKLSIRYGIHLSVNFGSRSWLSRCGS